MKWSNNLQSNNKIESVQRNQSGWLSEGPEICDLLYCKSDKWSAQTKKSEKTKKAEAQLTYTKNTSMNK